MPPTPPAATRLAALSCALTVAAALALAACGSGEGASAEATPKETGAGASGAVGRPARAPACPASIGTLVEDLASLRRRLTVGLSYRQYANSVKRLRRIYGEVPVDRLGLGCLSATATPAERALNEYIDGVNAWGECLATAGCAIASIEPVLQRKWRRAARLLAEAG